MCLIYSLSDTPSYALLCFVSLFILFTMFRGKKQQKKFNIYGTQTRDFSKCCVTLLIFFQQFALMHYTVKSC